MIRSLGEDVRSLLRSGIAVSSLTQCIDELVVNSLDASASCVTVRVDIPSLRVQVSDNGSGISRDDLDVLGERYATSKCQTLSDLENIKSYGFRGEALASVRDIAGILEVVSRHRSSYRTYCKTFQNGKPLKVTESCKPRSNVGTTVTVHDVFSRLPVRCKLLSDVFEVEKIRQRVASIALINPGVSFSLYNEATGQTCLSTRKCQSINSSFSQLFGNLKAKALREVSSESGSVKVSGHICLLSHHSKSLQFIYINGRLLIKTKIHKLVNQMFNKSSLLKKGSLSHYNGPLKQDQLKSPPKQGAEKYGIFVLNITCPATAYDITLEPGKTLVEFDDWERVLDVVKNCIENFLIKHNLQLATDDDSEDLSHAEDSGDSQVDLSIYEYQSGALDCIHPCNIKKSLQSSVVSRNITEGDRCEDTGVIIEENITLRKDSGLYNQISSTTTPTDSVLEKVPPLLPGKGMITRQLSSRNCFSSPNPITLKSRGTVKPTQSYNTKLKHHNNKQRKHPTIDNIPCMSSTEDGITQSNLPPQLWTSTGSESTENISESRKEQNSFSITVKTGKSDGGVDGDGDGDDGSSGSVDDDDGSGGGGDDNGDGIDDNGDGIDDNGDDDKQVEESFTYSKETNQPQMAVDKESHQPMVSPRPLASVSSEEVTLTDHIQTPTADTNPASIPNNTGPIPPMADRDWRVIHDNNLRKDIYYNPRTGNTFFEHPINTNKDFLNEDDQWDGNENGKNHVPLACAPHISFDCTPWLPRPDRPRQEAHEDGIESPSMRQSGSRVCHMLDEWMNPVFESASEMGVTSLSKPTVLRNTVSLHSAVHPYRFTKEMVKSLDVIQQVDDKFILCQLQHEDIDCKDKQCGQTEYESLIVLLDQHAVHERIRLEKLISDILDKKNPNEKPSLPQVKSSAIFPMELEVTPQELLLIKRFRKELQRVGIMLAIGSESSTAPSVMVQELPCVFVERERSETRRHRPSVAAAIVKELIETHIEHLKQTNGVSPVIPKTIYRVLSSQACRGAIKFGEHLSTTECEELIGQLSTCDLPFQCAHGRPSIIPLVDLKLLKSKQLLVQTDCKPPKLKRLANAMRS